MPAGPWIVFDRAKEKLADGVFDLDGHTFKVALCLATQAIAADFAGASTDARYADLTHELANGDGYATGGATLSGVTWNRSGGTVTFDCADPQWESMTKTGIKYAVIYSDTATNKDLLAVCELDTGGTIAVTDGTFTILIDADGIFSLS
ncbi:MAG TPA: hypothetical protein PKY87_12490 [Terricaulis sp.]|nr:hypothetical protein [Terricaulis sp.]